MKIAVIKYGGAAMESSELMKATMEDIAQLKELGINPVIVHGGGPLISKLCKKMGIIPQFIDGLRITDDETMEIVQMVLAGKINKELVFHLSKQRNKAIGLSGQDGALLFANQLKGLGFVGEVDKVNTAVLNMLLASGYIPVIAPIAASTEILGLNINADSAASHIAMALKADYLLFLSDVPGILQDREKIDTIDRKEIKKLIASGKITGGMIPKAQGALDALDGGVKEVAILDGRKAHSLLLYLQGKKIGTTFRWKQKRSLHSMTNT
jgi:acetylglutamate kinase